MQPYDRHEVCVGGGKKGSVKEGGKVLSDLADRPTTQATPYSSSVRLGLELDTDAR